MLVCFFVQVFLIILFHRYSRSNYSVWYYGESEIPRIVSDSVDFIVSQHLIEASGSKITSKTVY